MSIIIASVLPLYIIGLLVMALFQLLGGKVLAKLQNATYGSSLLICFYSTLLTAIVLIFLGSIEALNSIEIGIVFSVFFPFVSLIYITKLKWNCPSYSSAFKASFINIIINAFFWYSILSKFSAFFLKQAF